MICEEIMSLPSTSVVFEAACEHIVNGDLTSAAISWLGMKTIHEHVAINVPKLDEDSLKLRTLGNKAFGRKDFHKALNLYNAALAHAPNRSPELKLAYGNRSAVFYELNKFDACLKDIEVCETLGYPREKLPKLIERKVRCLESLKKNETENQLKEAASKFFHSTTPKLTQKNDSIKEVSVDGANCLLANRNIEVGETVVINKPLVSVLRRKQSLVCCYYCFRFTENLIPCPGCCFVLFCNTQCLEKCNREYHLVECPIMPMYAFTNNETWACFRAAIKMICSCGSWDRFIKRTAEAKDEFKVMSGEKSRKRVSQLSEFALTTACVVACLDASTDLFPGPHSYKQKCIGSFVKYIMSMCDVGIDTMVRETTTGDNIVVVPYVYSLTPLATKLRHACNPNLLAVLVNNHIHLIAQAPICKGEQLTLSYGYLNQAKIQRQTYLYQRFNFICECRACQNNWLWTKAQPTDDTERFFYQCLKEASSKPHPGLKLICQGVKEFHSKPKSYLHFGFNHLFVSVVMDYLAAKENHYTSGVNEVLDSVLEVQADSPVFCSG